MIIHGFQKTTLLDYPGKVACTVFTGGCNFRCPFCHNASLVLRPEDTETYSEEEILSFIYKRRGIIDGMCLTGGEPLINADVGDFLRKVKDAGISVKLDTNGSFPARLKELVSGGLVDYVAMDIKNRPEKYASTTGIDGLAFEKIRESIEFLLSGKVDFEFRTTTVKEFHTPEDFIAIGQLIKGAPRYFIQAYKNSGELISDGLSPLSREEYQKCLENVKPFVKEANLRGID